MARDLINFPGNEVNPSYLAETAKTLAKRTSLRCKILHTQDMKTRHGVFARSPGECAAPVLINLSTCQKRLWCTYCPYRQGHHV